MNELKFNSQVCTTIEQSQRLLNLGLKPETADMYHTTYYDANDNNNSARYTCVRHRILPLLSQDIPAWSLHRLMELLPQDIHLDDYVDTHYYPTINPFKVIYVNSHHLWIYQRDEGCLYDKLIDTIEWTIKNNFFNKEYLKQ